MTSEERAKAATECIWDSQATAGCFDHHAIVPIIRSAIDKAVTEAYERMFCEAHVPDDGEGIRQCPCCVAVNAREEQAEARRQALLEGAERLALSGHPKFRWAIAELRRMAEAPEKEKPDKPQETSDGTAESQA